MRDIVWTLIVIWLIYKLVDVFKFLSAKKSYIQNSSSQQNNTQTTTPKKDIHRAIQKHMNKEGEYVDFEEIK